MRNKLNISGNQNKMRRLLTSGFTLAELMLGVLILSILMALTIPNLLSTQKRLRQKELDAKAEIIYVAAQNSLTKLQVGGKTDVYAGSDDRRMENDPSDAMVQIGEDGEAVEIGYYFVVPGDDVADALLPADSIDKTLLGKSWVIEYSPQAGSIYAVFYSEDRDIATDYISNPGKYDTLRDRQERIKDGAEVGYYGGDIASVSNIASELQPTLTVNNGERLSVTMQCTGPNKIKGLQFTLNITDSYGHKYTEKVSLSSGVPNGTSGDATGGNYIGSKGKNYYYTIFLDDLSDENLRFNKLYGSESGHSPNKQLVPGTELKLEFSARSTGWLIRPSEKVRKTTNSLFADDSTSDKAVIRYGRHLQNLDESSGLNEIEEYAIVTKAVQKNDINFGQDIMKSDDWADIYGDEYFNGLIADGVPNFKPIENSKLTEYNAFDTEGFDIESGSGNEYQIRNLNVESTGDAGLFKTISGDTKLSHVVLIDAKVKGDNTGTLVGTVTGTNNVIENCKVYLLRDTVSVLRDTLAGNADEYIWISGDSSVGGLVGKSDGQLSIEQSFAASVLSDDDIGGGLVGQATTAANDSGLKINLSYADSYITAKETGGLVGKGNVAEVTESYSAGFQTADITAAGLVNGTIGKAHNVYTIAAMFGAKELNPETGEEVRKKINQYSTAVSISDTANSSVVYFLSGSSKEEYNLSLTTAMGTISSEDLQEKLGENFEIDTTYTAAYNLRDQGLSTYPYPRLKINEHYGDWQAEFKAGGLIYYEKYSGAEREYGFYGANVKSTLTEKGVVVGDGYGVVYRTTDAIPYTVTVEIEGYEPFELDTSTYYLVEGLDDYEYRVIPIDRYILNSPPANEYYYQQVCVSTQADNESDEIEETFYFFNPYFAETVVDSRRNAVRPTLREDAEISMRTPRHIYDMSLYYDDYYRKDTVGRTFVQERNLDYALYDWTGFTNYIPNYDQMPLYEQAPIGRTPETAFNATYDGRGNSIMNIAFVSEAGKYIGMFGYNSGELKDMVLVTDYNPAENGHYYVKRAQAMMTNERVYMGVLAGYNDGTIINTAVAGYYISGSEATLHAYDNSYLYAGGMVGINEGIIMDCEADSPAMRLSSSYASEVLIGGMVGWNTISGVIANCYDIGHIEAAYSRGEIGTVRLAGFAGRNEGVINNSYCATSLIASGEAVNTYGFAPSGGWVSNCYYLDNGTYRFIDTLRSYSSNHKTTSGTPISYVELTRNRGTSVATEERTTHHINTNNNQPTAYPYRAVVKNLNGEYVHYGDWQNEPVLGTLGIFYWEHEEFGSNNGYHFTYIGTDEGNADSGTSLCNAHDDGGVITEYGYGYYIQQGDEEKISVDFENIAVSDNYNTRVAEEMNQLVNKYTFYPFTTRVGNSSSAYDYIYLLSSLNTSSGKDINTEGQMILHYNGKEGVKDYYYTVNPFFANAFSREGAGEVLGLDNNLTDYGKTPGEYDVYSENKYEIRSIQQLRYINWNYVSEDCDTLIYGNGQDGNYKHFPFLQYATQVTNGVQKFDAVDAKRPRQYWRQSHDLKSVGESKFTPIAAMGTSSPFSSGSYSNILYGWFGGSFDGQNYKIQNLNIESEAYAVGLFSVTAGANISNIIMYSDNSSHVKRTTEGKTAVVVEGAPNPINYEKGPGAYNIGGLVGIAYEYYYSNKQPITNKIENCAVAGYQIIDASTNQQGAGTGNVGGLAGWANVNLLRCSSVNDIIIDCTHEYGHHAWGSYIRIGGLCGSAGSVGSVSVSVTDCYTGGRVIVNERTLWEQPLFDNNGWALRDGGNVGKSLNIFVAGLLGGSYAPNISNFTNQTSNQPDGTAYINNCYTFLQLPDLEGSIRAISLFAGQGDRYNRTTKIYVNNCYYLKSIAENIGHPSRDDPSTWPQYLFVAAKNQLSGVTKAPTLADRQAMIDGDEALFNKYKNAVMSDEEFEDMLNGNLSCLTKYLYSQNAAGGHMPDPASPITYEQLELIGADALNGADGNAWGYVTTVDYGHAHIDGKYSFSSNPAQEGKNYPFPTVVTQPDLTFGNDVNVHYGEWPINGYYWENGRDSIDIFADMNLDDIGEDGPYAEKTFRLKFDRVKDDQRIEEADISISPAGIVELMSVELDETNKCYVVKLKALQDGTTIVREDNSGASFVVSVTGRLTLSAIPEEIITKEGVLNQTALTAGSVRGGVVRDYSYVKINGVTYSEWTLKTSEEEESTLVEIAKGTKEEVEQGIVPEKDDIWCVKGLESSVITLEANYSYNYHGRIFTDKTFIEFRSIGYVGITDGKKFYTVQRDFEGEFNSQETEYENNPPGVKEGYEIALYSDLVEDELGEFNIKEIKVIENNGNEYVVEEDGYAYSEEETPEGIVRTPIYLVRFGNVEYGDGVSNGYEYRFGTIRYYGDDPDAKAKIMVTLDEPYARNEEPEEGEEPAEPIEEVRYHLLLDDWMEFPRYTVSFNANGGNGQMISFGVPSGEFELPSTEAFTRYGYHAVGWEVHTTEGEVIPVEDNVFDVQSDVTFFVTWEANKYTVFFNGNGGYIPDSETEEMEPQEFEYDADEIALSANLYVKDEGDTIFDGWNTEIDGSGLSYENGALVKNLTAEDNGEVTLYAQWKSGYAVHLLINDEEDIYIHPENNTTDIPDYLDYFADLAANDWKQDYWTLEGWCINTDIGEQKLLNADGSINIDNLPGYTENGQFKLESDIELHALWKAKRYKRIEVLQKTDDSTGNGIYMIVSDGVDENRVAMKTVGNYGSYSLSHEDVVIENNLDGKIIDSEGNAIEAFIPDKDYEGVDFEFIYRYTNTVVRTDPEIYGTIIDAYSVRPMMEGNTNYYLNKADNDNITYQLINDENEFIKPLNNIPGLNQGYRKWTYGQRYPHTLETQYAAVYQKDYDSVYWNGTIWKRTSRKNEERKFAYLYEKIDEPIYKFD